MDRIIKGPGRRVIALGDGRVHLQAALTRGCVLSAQGAFFLTVWVTEGLNQARMSNEDRGSGKRGGAWWHVYQAVRCDARRCRTKVKRREIPDLAVLVQYVVVPGNLSKFIIDFREL